MLPPEKPIVFIVEKTVPLQWRKYVAEGIMEWNKAFEKVGISKKEAAEIIEVVLNAIKNVLQEGQSVKIAGFGNFIVRKKRARKGRNPKTGQEIGITPRKVVTFRPSQVFKKYVNSVQSV